MTTARTDSSTAPARNAVGIVSSDLFGLSFVARPLLVSGMLAKGKDGRWLVLVDSEQPKEEAAIAAWHELAHLLVGSDEDKAEALARRLAVAVPEILEIAGIAFAWPNAERRRPDGEGGLKQ